MTSFRRQAVGQVQRQTAVHQHEPRHAVGVQVPQHEGDERAHGVPDDDGAARTPSASSTATRSAAWASSPAGPRARCSDPGPADRARSRARTAGARATSGQDRWDAVTPWISRTAGAASGSLDVADRDPRRRRAGPRPRRARRSCDTARAHREVHPPSIVYEAPVTMPAWSETSHPASDATSVRPRRAA